jgi:hypothetical protein
MASADSTEKTAAQEEGMPPRFKVRAVVWFDGATRQDVELVFEACPRGAST